MCCKLEIFVMAPVGTQFEHNQGDSDQHGPCQSSWFTGADSSQNVMKNVSYQFFKKSSSLVVDILFDTHLFSVFFFRTRCLSVFSFYPLFATFRDTWEVDISGVGTTGNEEVREIPQVFGHIFVNSYTASNICCLWFMYPLYSLCPHSI